MAEEPTPSLQIDTDWKKQAQEEKRKLAEQQKQREQQSVATAAPASTAGAGGGSVVGAGGPTGSSMRSASSAPGSAGTARRGESAEASFASLVQSMVTQTLYYLGDLAPRGGEPVVNLDMAKHHIDTLAVIESKTVNNLTPEEKRLLDAALYETRMRYVSVASQYIS